jgi:hypothetical protein
MENLNEACWEGYKAVGGKMKNGKMVPNCVPINEDELDEAIPPQAGLAIGKGIGKWVATVAGLVGAGTLSPAAGVAVGIGVPVLVGLGFAKGDDLVRSAKQFIRNAKDKRKINPEQTKELISKVVDATRELPKGKQRHVAKLMKTHQSAITSGDKNKILAAQRDLKSYANQQIDKDNQAQDTLQRATPRRQPSSAEKRIAPAGAVHAGFGRWTDTSGKTLGYTRDGRWVPAKQKISENEQIDEINEYCNACLMEYIQQHANMLEEAEYHGRKVPLGKPMRGDVKKFKVFVKDPSTGNVKKVNFGDKTMRIKKSNPARRKSFRARHNCDNPGPRTKARYWSCRKW